jgi:hypothetical protein
MRCHVCSASWPDGGASLCPQCGFDAKGPGANDPAVILRARDAFRDKTTAYAPDTRVTAMDKMKPWLALVLGFFLFVLWWATCSGGRHFF